MQLDNKLMAIPNYNIIYIMVEVKINYHST